MFSFDETTSVLTCTLPQGKSGQELVNEARTAIQEIAKSRVTFGKDVVIDGRITGAVCLAIGHELAHICKSVSITAPMEGSSILCISH